MGDVISRQDTPITNAAAPKSRSTNLSAVREAQSLVGTRGALRNSGTPLHHETLGKAVEDDEADVIDDMFLLEEFHKHAPQLRHRLTKRLAAQLPLPPVGRMKK